MAQNTGSDRKNTRASGSITRNRIRLRVGLALVLALLLIISGKLFLIQGLDTGSMAEAAINQRTVVSKLPATRGEIVDANGKVMAQSIVRYNITVSPKNSTAADTFVRKNSGTGNVDTVTRDEGIQELADALSLKEADVRKTVTGNSDFAYVSKGVTAAVESKVMDLQLPGIYSEATSERTYPLGAVGGSIVGFLGSDGTPLAGIEQTLNSKLQGADGSRKYQRGANGIVIPTAPEENQPAVDGETVKLTINSDLQYFAQQAISDQVKKFSAQWGNIVVVQAKTGKIVAMAEDSTVDPNNPGATDAANRGARSVTAAIEPGSTEKTVTAAATIQEGKVSPLSHVLVPPTYTVNGENFADAFTHGTEQRTFAGIIGDSMNTGTVMVGERLSKQQRYDYLHNFGIGQATGIPLPGENAGILAQPDSWDGRQEFTVLFGQGVSQTPLQTAMIYQTIANNGVRLKPQLVESYIDPDGTEHKVDGSAGTEVVSPQSAQQVKDILESVVTAADAKDVSVPGYRVGGKTGTAEAVRDDGAGFEGYTASFVGMAPMEDPQYVVLVTVQRPQGDIYGISQAPVFNSVMGQVLHSNNVPPSTTHSVALPQKY
ncbi:penicillin-binding protein 2 [Paenarthrobacter sp. PH39-S1]|uniref:peptidoglycan D,D-transpeptidase FtsI family protein n=1 Tax=Paenarthrobacter sp. PH39-S1 TaxID=3046204 RepID=UPI0024BB6AC3|nr:penicillin-binding protein 2 [Paenarthrobacter sp. PH39-S1]MDJ0356948.1 penicillin-binding protein 2 [Paenarthrobacter sp. PH39-S1]